MESFFNFDASFDPNSILAYETDELSFYVLRLEEAEARAAVRAESFSVPGWAEYPASTVPIDSFVISHLPSAVAFMTVTVFRAGAWFLGLLASHRRPRHTGYARAVPWQLVRHS